MKINNFTIKSINNYNISTTYYEPDTLIRENMSHFKEKGFTELGFERKMNIPYSFYEDLI